MPILNGFPQGSAEAINAYWEEVEKWTTRGTYTWTAPDLFGGKPYIIGVVVIGAGGGGCSNVTSFSGDTSFGGASGHASFCVLKVYPGSTHSITVGAGGAGIYTSTSDSSSQKGRDGSPSAFDDVTASGGEGGGRGTAPAGGQGPFIPLSETDTTPYGGVVKTWQANMLGVPCRGTTPAECVNPFTLQPILAAGGSCAEGYVSNAKTQTSANVNGYRTSGSKYSETGTILAATKGTLPGCGGGAVLVRNMSLVASAAEGAYGCDGAVYIYKRAI